MPLYSTSEELLYNLEAVTSSEARRKWRQLIKEKWNYECAYCGSDKVLTLDHIVPRSKGGADITRNVVCCCHSCNQSKGHNHWELWYMQQDFYSEDNFNKISDWIKPPTPTNLYSYRPRKNIVS